MIALVEVGLTTTAAALLLFAAVIFIECAAALLPAARRRIVRTQTRPSTVVIVPAHNEEAVLEGCLRSLRLQLGSEDQLVVVADNCDDDTAAVARSHGATVIERRSADEHGKGYALDCGVSSLRAAPPEVVVMVDADCIVAPGSIEALVGLAAAAQRPAQATYVVEPPAEPTALDLISALAFRVKNLARARGLDRLGLPCLLQGSGMAFPWSLIRDLPLATARTAEDLRMTVELARRGCPPVFCPEALVTGRLRSAHQGGRTQRARWEHGHLEALFPSAIALLFAAVRQRRLGLLTLALDLSVPPLSLFFLLSSVTFAAAVSAWLAGASPLPAFLSTLSPVVAALAILVAWGRFGRSLVPPRVLLTAPAYVVRKVPLYLDFFRRRQAAWKTRPRKTRFPTR